MCRSHQNGHQSRHQAHHGSTASLRNGRYYDQAAGDVGGIIAERQFFQNGSSGGGSKSLQRHTEHRSSKRSGFNESSSYETNEHFERKVEKIKRTRGGESSSASRSKVTNGVNEYESKERLAIQVR